MPAHYAPPATSPVLAVPARAKPDPTVVLIDDDPLYLDYVSGLLAKQGITRVTTLDARQALFPMLNGIEADCLVIDYDLGEDNGLNVAQRLLAEREDAPALVMMTGTGSERTAIKAMRLGFHDYVSKRSLTATEMARAVQRAIEVRRAPAPALPAAPVETHAPTGLPARSRMETTLAGLCAGRSRRPFAFGLVEPDLAEVSARLGLGAVERARESFVFALRKRCGGAGLVAHWEGERFAWAFDDAAAAPDPFGRTMRDLPAALECTVELDGAWARVPARAGALLLPPGAHDPHEVAAAASRLLDAAIAEGTGQRHEVRGHHAAPTLNAAGEAGRDERRRERRMRCLKLARVILPGDRAVVDCVATNLSAGGACLTAKSFFVAPDAFSVEIVGSGERRPARVAWQKGSVMGIAFSGTVH